MFNELLPVFHTNSNSNPHLLKGVGSALVNQPQVLTSQAQSIITNNILTETVQDIFSIQKEPEPAPFSIYNRPAQTAPLSMSTPPAFNALTPEEYGQFKKLPKHIQQSISDFQKQSFNTQDDFTFQLQGYLKTALIPSIAYGSKINFAEKDGREWNVKNLLDLANAIQKLPIAHRKQLDGITFVRDDYPNAPPDSKPNLFDKLTARSIAGYYDLQSRSITLYDQGINDDLPILDDDIRTSLRQMKSNTSSEDIHALQQMLNPYLSSLGYEKLNATGYYGPQTAKAIRTVQAKLMSNYLEQNKSLTPEQKIGLEQLLKSVRENQFGTASGVLKLKEALKQLNILPTPQLQYLLNEMANNQLGETTLRFLLNDISNSFRMNKQSSRTEEVMIHEMGHHVQLGLSSENQYIREFGKLSGWLETPDNSVADGYVNGSYSGEVLSDVYNNLASDGKVDAGNYKHQAGCADCRRSNFISNYAKTDPMEDFAESYKTYILNPAELLEKAPEKFFFINALPTIQDRLKGKESGYREKSLYLDADIRALMTQNLTKKMLQQQSQQTNTGGLLGISNPSLFGNISGKSLWMKKDLPPDVQPSKEQIDNELRQIFERMATGSGKQEDMSLDPETLLGIYQTHEALLSGVDVSVLALRKEYRYNNSDADYQVLRMIHTQATHLVYSDINQTLASKQFFSDFAKPGGPEKVLGKQLLDRASADMKENLKDPNFSAMMLAMGKISGYAQAVYYARQMDSPYQQKYDNASQSVGNTFTQITKQPWQQTLSLHTLGDVAKKSYNYFSSLVDYKVNNQEDEIKTGMDFLEQLKAKPEVALAEAWPNLPQDFKDMIHTERFLNAITGDQGRYVPSPESIKNTLEKIMSLVEYQRKLDKLQEVIRHKKMQEAAQANTPTPPARTPQ